MNYNMSSELNNYIRVKIGEAKSKEEEDQAVKKNLEKIRQEIIKTNLSENQIWEIILQILYGEMLGHNTDFCHSFIVNQVQNISYKIKRIAYLACEILLDEDSPFRIMMVASLQKDLENNCLYNKIIALNTLNKILCPLNASAFIENIQKLILNPQSVVKKKALLVAVRLEQICPGSIESFDEVMEMALRDKDASIMLSVLPYYHRSIQKNPEKYKTKLYIFIQIFQQILQKKLSSEYDYDTQPAPWAVIKILQIIKYLCQNDKNQSQQVYNSLKVFLRSFTFISTDVDIVALFQSIMTITQIYPNEELLSMCLEKLNTIQKNGLLKENNTLLLVLKIISQLADLGSQYIQNHQLLLLDCLDQEDDTIKNMTINILFKTIQENNINMVLDKIHDFCKCSSDLTFKQQTIKKIYEIVEIKAPQPQWFLQQSLKILEYDQDQLDQSILNSIIKNLKEIFQYEEQNKTELVLEFLSIFQQFVQKNSLTDYFVDIFVWFIGEYFEYIDDYFPAENLIELIEYIQQEKLQGETYGYIYTGLYKMSLKTNQQKIKDYLNNLNLNDNVQDNNDSQIRLFEYQSFKNQNQQIFEAEFQGNFDFLDSFVKDSISKGGKTYNPNFQYHKEKKEEKLVTKYTTEQIKSNLKKNMEGADKVFKYKGKAKWSKEGYKGLEKDEEQVQNKFEQKKEIKFTFDEQEQQQEAIKQNDNVQEIQSKKKDKKNRKRRKKNNLKSKLASELFGGTELNIQNDKKNIDKIIGKNQDKKENNNFDFLNELTQQQQQKSQQNDLDFLQDSQKQKVNPYIISLEQYQQQWEDLGDEQYDKNFNYHGTLQQLNQLMQDFGFHIVDQGEKEFLSSGYMNEDKLLVYLSLENQPQVEMIGKGNTKILDELVKSFNQINKQKLYVRNIDKIIKSIQENNITNVQLWLKRNFILNFEKKIRRTYIFNDEY